MRLEPRSSHETQPPAPCRRSLVTTERGRRDKGYILVQFALLLVPLLLMVGFSVDVGYWYNRASDIQKAADAAALAGVVWLPDVPEARTQATRRRRPRNGFAHDPTAPASPSPSTRVAGTTRQLRVTITDPRVGSFFFENLGGTEHRPLAQGDRGVPAAGPPRAARRTPSATTWTSRPRSAPGCGATSTARRPTTPRATPTPPGARGSEDCTHVQQPEVPHHRVPVHDRRAGRRLQHDGQGLRRRALPPREPEPRDR